MGFKDTLGYVECYPGFLSKRIFDDFVKKLKNNHMNQSPHFEARHPKERRIGYVPVVLYAKVRRTTHR